MLELCAFQPLIVIGKIKPHDIDLAVIGEQLPDLVVEVGNIIVPIVLHIFVGFIVPHGVLPVPIVGKIRMMPVDHRVIKTDLDSLCPEGLHIFPHQISSALGIGALIVGVSGIKQTKAIVMLCGEHRVFHAGLLRQLSPFPRIVADRIKFLKIFLIFLCGNFFIAFYPLSPGRNGI